MSRNAMIGIGGGVLLLAVAYFLTSHLSSLTDRLSELDQQVEQLNSDLAEASEEAANATLRADAAEQAATAAGQRADEAAAKEQQSALQAVEAEQARHEAEKETQRALLQQAEAKHLADEAMAALVVAEDEKIAAQIARDEAALEVEAAQSETARVEAEIEAIRRQQQEELDRLHLALGQIVETRRTALGVVMNLDSEQIEFDFDKAALRPRNRELLSRIAGVLLTSDDYGLQVFGHTDDVGSEEYNQDLSERRAEAVREYLIQTGIDADVISSMGMGKRAPLVEGTDAVARQRNRRVELALVFSEGEVGDLVDQDG